MKVRHRPRLLSDNGPAYVSKDLREYLAERGMMHTRGRPYHPQTQGKIERYLRSMKNVVKLEHYYFPWQLEQAIGDFVAYYNHERTTSRSTTSRHWTSTPGDTERSCPRGRRSNGSRCSAERGSTGQRKLPRSKP